LHNASLNAASKKLIDCDSPNLLDAKSSSPCIAKPNVGAERSAQPSARATGWVPVLLGSLIWLCQFQSGLNNV
jgi:hypothetical protein